MQALAAVAQAVAAVILVGVTAWYARLTSRIASGTSEQAAEMQAQRRAATETQERDQRLRRDALLATVKLLFEQQSSLPQTGAAFHNERVTPWWAGEIDDFVIQARAVHGIDQLEVVKAASALRHLATMVEGKLEEANSTPQTTIYFWNSFVAEQYEGALEAAAESLVRLEKELAAFQKQPTSPQRSA